MLKINKTYTHYKNNQNYIVLNFCKIQENDQWVKAVLYRPEDEDLLFVRSYEEFNKKFKEKTD